MRGGQSWGWNVAVDSLIVGPNSSPFFARDVLYDLVFNSVEYALAFVILGPADVRCNPNEEGALL